MRRLYVGVNARRIARIAASFTLGIALAFAFFMAHFTLQNPFKGLSLSKLSTQLLIAPVVALGALYSPSSGAVTDGSNCADQSIVLGFSGDVLIHDALYRSILDKQSFIPLWQPIVPLFKKADYMVVNLEGPTAMGITKELKDLGDVGFTYDTNVYSGTNFLFNFHPQVLTDLQNSGVDLVSNANNHSLDRGSIGIDRTVEAAESLRVPVVGIKHSRAANPLNYYVANVQGYRLAFIACTEMTNRFVDKKRQLLFCYQDAAKIEKEIRELSARTDIDGVIVMPHWGVEYKATPDSEQRTHAQKFLNAGAMAIIGSHPHVLQPVEHVTTADGRKALVAYSMGNFLAYQKDLNRKTGAVIYLRLQRDSRGQVQLVNTYYTPTYRDALQVLPATKKYFQAARDHAAEFFKQETLVEANQRICE